MDKWTGNWIGCVRKRRDSGRRGSAVGAEHGADKRSPFTQVQDKHTRVVPFSGQAGAGYVLDKIVQEFLKKQS